MNTLSSINVGNFKAFAESLYIPLKPITLIFEPNTALANKASFMLWPLLMRHGYAEKTW